MQHPLMIETLRKLGKDWANKKKKELIDTDNSIVIASGQEGWVEVEEGIG